MSSSQYRRFGDRVNEVADRWINTDVSDESWTLAAPVGRGEAGSLYADSESGLRGVAKLADHAGGTPRAAHEKIASDLAYHLELPVPPVVLWTNPDTGDRYAISLFAFPQALTWDEAAAARTAEFLANVAPALAACYVFHNWIEDKDHHDGNGGNLLVDGGGSVDLPGIAAIDHAFAMTYTWNSCPAPHSPIPRYYIPPSELPPEAISDAVTRVQQMPEELVEKIVKRVPEVYLSSEKGRLIVECLLQRRAELASLVR